MNYIIVTWSLYYWSLYYISSDTNHYNEFTIIYIISLTIDNYNYTLLSGKSTGRPWK